jgi:organic hydroperoxide reductase OsmC/OhrA
MPIYKNKVEWRGEHLGHTWCQNGAEMDFSAPPDLHGMPDVLTPEDAFVAAANTCYFLMIIWAAKRFQMEILSFVCEAEGEVETFLDRTSWFKTVILRPKVVLKNKPKERIERVLEIALKYSTICQSLKSEVKVFPTIVIRQDRS